MGNASELVQGYYGVYPEGQETLVDPQGPTNTWGNIRMIRGGGNVVVDHLIPNDLAIGLVCDSYPAEGRSACGNYLALYGGRERAGLRLVAELLSVQAAAK